jgi:hypothetical protein
MITVQIGQRTVDTHGNTLTGKTVVFGCYAIDLFVVREGVKTKEA